MQNIEFKFNNYPYPQRLYWQHITLGNYNTAVIKINIVFKKYSIPRLYIITDGEPLIISISPQATASIQPSGYATARIRQIS